MPGRGTRAADISSRRKASGSWSTVARARSRTFNFTQTFAASTLFLVGYVVYHAVHGDTPFGGAGAIRGFYFAVLASHVLLSMMVVPLVLLALWFAFKREFQRHARVTRWLHPLWLYVSVTGVVVFLMLRPYYPS